MANTMKLLACPLNGFAAFWGNLVTKDKTGQTYRCTKCGQVGHGIIRT